MENTKNLEWYDVTKWTTVHTFGRRCLATPTPGFGRNISLEAKGDGFLILMAYQRGALMIRTLKRVNLHLPR